MVKRVLDKIKTKDVLISLLILGVAFGYYICDYIPENLQSINFYFIEIGTFGFSDILQMINYVKMKFLIIAFSIIWYFTCRHWWKFGILVIIVIEISKLVSTLTNEHRASDEIDYLISLPFTLPIILMLIFISYKLNSYNLAKEIHSQINNEIDNVFLDVNSKKKFNLDVLKKKFLEVKSQKNHIDSHNYLRILIEIRNDFYKTLK